MPKPKVLGGIDYGLITASVASGITLKEPLKTRRLTSSDTPGRSWKLTSGEIYKPVKQALVDREPYNIRKLTSSDTPSRSWKLTSGEIYKPTIQAFKKARTSSTESPAVYVRAPAGTIIDPRDRTWTLTSSERAIYVGGSPIDPREIRKLTSSDTPGRSWKLTSDDVVTSRSKFVAGNLASADVIGANSTLGPLVIDGEGFTLYIKKIKGPASMLVGHEVRARPGGVWVEDGEDTFNTDLVVTFNHYIYEYRIRNKLSAASALVTIDYRIKK